VLTLENMQIIVSEPSSKLPKATAQFEVFGDQHLVELSIADLSIDRGSYVLPYDIDAVATAIDLHVREYGVEPPLNESLLCWMTGELSELTGRDFYFQDNGITFTLHEDFEDRPSKSLFVAVDLFEAWEDLKARIEVAKMMREITA